MNITSLLTEHEEALQKVQDHLGYRFKEPRLLLRALIHRSSIFEENGGTKEDNETLEFLGDAVLDLAISVILINRYPGMNEGELTKVRAALVQEGHLALMARQEHLGDFLILGRGEEVSGGRQKSSILSCAFEAVMGAIFQDGGYEAVFKVVEEKFKGRLEQGRRDALLADAKSRLQELIQEKHNEGPLYLLEKSEGPDHDKVFFVSVSFRGQVMATSRAKSKKAAEQKAAAEALELLETGQVTL